MHILKCVRPIDCMCALTSSWQAQRQETQAQTELKECRSSLADVTNQLRECQAREAPLLRPSKPSAARRGFRTRLSPMLSEPLDFVDSVGAFAPFAATPPSRSIFD